MSLPGSVDVQKRRSSSLIQPSIGENQNILGSLLDPGGAISLCSWYEQVAYVRMVTGHLCIRSSADVLMANKSGLHYIS